MEPPNDTIKRIWRRVLVLVIATSAYAIGLSSGVYWMQREAIKHEAALHDSKTGEWGWIDQVPQVDEKQLKAIDKKCKALGSKKSNDPACVLMGE